MARRKMTQRQRERSRSVRKIYKRIPTGLTMHFKRRKKGKKNRCAICGSLIKRIRGDKRIFGGIICPRCLSKIISFYTRVINEVIKVEEVDLRYRKYVKMLIEGKEKGKESGKESGKK